MSNDMISLYSLFFDGRNGIYELVYLIFNYFCRLFMMQTNLQSWSKRRRNFRTGLSIIKINVKELQKDLK